MSESTIKCPHCNRTFEAATALTDAIELRIKAQYEAQNAQFIAQAQADKQKLLDQAKAQQQSAAQAQAAIVAQQATLKQQQLDFEQSKTHAEAINAQKVAQQVELQVNQKLTLERKQIESQAQAKAQADAAARLQANEEEVQNLRKKVAESQQLEIEARKAKQAAEEAHREASLRADREVDRRTQEIREKASQEAQEEARLKLTEKDQLIESLRKQAEEMRRKSEQGSQQSQGEALEIEFENTLRAKFPRDSIEPVPKGQFGGDVLQRVFSPTGQLCGTILWESKRTKTWSDGWLTKLRSDQRAANADVCALVSTKLPDGVQTFDLIDGVWVTGQPCAMPMAVALRQMLIDLASTRTASMNIATKRDVMYQYMTGGKFKLRLQAVLESYAAMKEDLEKERRAIVKQWAKREEHIDRIMQATAGMRGDLEGIAGNDLPEIELLDIKALES